MLQDKFITKTAIIAGFGLLATGCAATATGSSGTRLAVEPANVGLSQFVDSGSALVTIRYPAMIDASAQVAFREAYQTKPIGGSFSEPVLGEEDANAIADTFAIKSNYFAMSLFQELKGRLPAHSILLSPHQVTLGPNGELISESIAEADVEQFPSVLTVDFATYSFPDIDRMMNSEPLTFGDLVSPLMVIHTDHRGLPPTDGVALASETLLASSSKRAVTSRSASIVGLQNGVFESKSPTLDFISYLNGDAGGSLPTARINQSVASSNAVVVYPDEKLRMPEMSMRQMMTDTSNPSVDPLVPAFTDAAADRIVATLNMVDDHKATMVQRAAAYSRLDQDLGALSFTGLNTVDYQERLALATKLLDAERQFLAVRSDNLFQDVYLGEFGAQTREMMKAEYDTLLERRNLANQQNLATGLAILGAVAAVGAGTADNYSENEHLATQIAVGVAAVAAMKAYNLKVTSDAIGKNYMVAMAPSLKSQVAVNVSLLDSDVVITAASIEQFREQTKQIYDQYATAMDAVATECGYNHDQAKIVGKWLGECANGVGSGVGAGIVEYTDGSTVEYYGQTLEGQPDGVGFMINHNGSETVAFEGHFRAGKPHGIIRVSAPGQADTLVSYDGGSPTGPAPDGSNAASLFDLTPNTDIVAYLHNIGTDPKG